MRVALFHTLFLAMVCVVHSAVADTPSIEPLVKAVDLNIGEQKTVELCDGTTARVKLVDVKERRDSVRQALREAQVTIEVDGQPITITACTYNLPKTIGHVQIECPVTKGYIQKGKNPWALDRDARLRLWPKDSPWIRPGTFGYPVQQRWLASQTQMSNQLADGEKVDNKPKYYHWGLDFGGVNGVDQVVAATDGTVVSAGGKTLGKGPYPKTLHPRYDVVYLRDARGWYYRYSHLDSIDPAIKLGAHVSMGQKIGVLGKRGASGGWAHLHFDISRLQPSGRYGIEDAYPYVWQAYQHQHPTPLVAIARPHELVYVDEPVTLDASKSYSALGPDQLRYEWTFDDGTTATGPRTTHRFVKPGNYRVTLKATDTKGRVDYDFARVFVLSCKNPRKRPPDVHAAYWPTFGIKPGDPVTFKAITREIKPGEGQEIWDFGDGTPPVTTQSKFDPPKRGPRNYEKLATYATTTHVFKKPGDYLVSVSRTNQRGETGTDRLHVRVEPSCPLRVATFTCDATPPLGHRLTEEPLKTIEHQLAAKGIVLDDGQQRYVLCTLDWCILSNGSHQQIRQKIADAVGTDIKNICVQTVHQHTAPVICSESTALFHDMDNPPKRIGTDFKFLKNTFNRIASSAKESLARLEPFDQIGTGQAKVDRVASDRRLPRGDGKVLPPRWSMTKDLELRAKPEGHIDPYLKTITLSQGDRPLVRLYYYAVHPQSWYRDGRASYDFVGMARQAMEEKEGVFQLYFTGCAGDVTVGKYNDATTATRDQFKKRLMQAMEASIASTHWAPADTIHWRTVPLHLPVRADKGFSIEDIRRQMARKKTKDILRTRAARWFVFAQRHLQQPIDVSVLNIGNVYILHLPGEPFVDYQLFAQRLRPNDFVAVAGYGDGGPCYLCDEAAYEEGGYEPTASMAKPEAEKALKEVIRKALE